METYDVLVLGGGTAGTRAASAAGELGARVALFDGGELGGLCILRGCMPTKTMLHAAHAAHDARHPPAPGVTSSGVAVDFAAVMANKDEKVARFQRSKVASIESGPYELVRERARFTGPDTVEAGGRAYRFTRGAVIATGSVPAFPSLPGLEDVEPLTSDDVMRLERAPASMIVLGVGAVGLELAQFFARMGTRVELVARRRVLADVDPLIADEMVAVLADEPDLTLHELARPQQVERAGAGVRVTMADGRVLEAERLLVATGRRPAVEGLGLEAAGVEPDGERLARGPDQRTSNPRVFAAGDATGDKQLLHVANWEGAVAGRNAATGGDERVEERLDLEVVFTDPPMARLGLSEAEARTRGHDPVSAAARFAETGRAITMDVRHGAFKLVADGARGEILGAQILGPRADDVIHALAVAMHHHATAADLLEVPWYHPTISEVTLSLAREIDRAVRERAPQGAAG